MKPGFILEVVESFVKTLNHLNLVEFVKFVSRSFTKSNDHDDLKKNSHTAIDIFIIVKWLLIIALWCNQTSGFVATAIVVYLLIMNLHTYFYYHVWCVESLIPSTMTFDRVKRRFLNVILALGFSDLCYAYLIHIPFHEHFLWPENINSQVAALQFSVANSLTASIWDMKATTNTGYILTLTQVLTTFVFLSVVLSQSVPQANIKGDPK